MGNGNLNVWKDDPQQIIKVTDFVMVNIGEEHTRIVTPLLSDIAAVGGLTEFFFTGCWIAYIFFG